MVDLPEASVSIDPEVGASALGLDYLVVLAAVPTDADITPRVFGSTKALLSKHGYSPGASYVAMHLEETKKPVIFLGLPIATAGAVSQEDDSGVDGTSAITVTAGASGVLDELEGELTVDVGGTIGTDQIKLTLSLDGGANEVPIRLGTANSYTVPYLGITFNFAAGTLIAEDVFTFRTSGPRWTRTDFAAARTALATQLKAARSWLIVGDLLVEDDAAEVVTQVNAYETTDQRFVYVRTQARDRHERAQLKRAGGGDITFAEVGATGDTITRVSGSWIADGFKVGGLITVTGTVSNNITAAPIAGVTATVITLGSTDLAAEVIAAALVTAYSPEEDGVDWVTDIESEFEDIDDEMRIDIAAGYARKVCPITQWKLRRPASWALSIREYQHDVQVPPWRKSDGELKGWDLEDADGNVVEHDERTQRSLLPARFSCLRTWANGPRGTFAAHSLTRSNGKFLSRTHNVAVANIACSVTQAQTEDAGIGAVLESNDDNTLTEGDLQGIETKVNSALSTALRQRKFEGVRASAVSWSASRTDIFNEPDSELTGAVVLRLNRTIEKLRTRVRVQ